MDRKNKNEISSQRSAENRTNNLFFSERSGASCRCGFGSSLRMATAFLGFIVDKALWLTWMLLTSAKHFLPFSSRTAQDENDAYLPWSRPSRPSISSNQDQFARFRSSPASIPCNKEHFERFRSSPASIPCKENFFERFRSYCTSITCKEGNLASFRPSCPSIHGNEEYNGGFSPSRGSISSNAENFERFNPSFSSISSNEEHFERLNPSCPSISRKEERFDRFEASCPSISSEDEHLVRSAAPPDLVECSETLPSASAINSEAKKRVRFAADVVEPSSNSKEYRRRHSRKLIRDQLSDYFTFAVIL